MDTTITRTWTAAEITDLFSEAHHLVDAENREATAGPFNPFGDAFESLVWHGTIQEAWESDRWRGLSEAVNADRDEELTWEDWADHAAEIEDTAKTEAETVVGTGRPLVVAFADGQYPCVFCEHATEEQVRDAVQAFYPLDETADED
jgi:hypothetical protein